MADLLHHLPLTSKAGVGTLVVLHVLFRAAPATVTHIFCLIPSNTFGGMVWNVVTSAFVERSPVGLAISASAFALYGHVFQPRWGLKEAVRFVLVCATSSALASCFALMVMYMATRAEQLLFVELSGFSGVVAGISVAIHQAAHSEAQRADVPNWLVGESRKVAMLYLLVHAAWCLLAGRVVDILLAMHGLLCGWIYLRFYQPHESELGPSMAAGDASEAFAFASMFFSSLQPAVDSVSRATWAIVELVVPPSMRAPSAPTNTFAFPATPSDHLPGSNPSLAEQRRARAMRSLEDRLGARGGDASGSRPTASWPPLPASARHAGAGTGTAADAGAAGVSGGHHAV